MTPERLQEIRQLLQVRNSDTHIHRLSADLLITSLLDEIDSIRAEKDDLQKKHYEQLNKYISLKNEAELIACELNRLRNCIRIGRILNEPNLMEKEPYGWIRAIRETIQHP